jgi:hypothetical protein
MASYIKLNSMSIRHTLAQMSKDVALGQALPMDLLLVLKQVKELIDDIEVTHAEDFNKAAMFYNKQVYDGYNIEVRTGGGRYNYDHIPQIVSLSEQIKELQAKAQSSYRIALTSLSAVSEDGELITPAKFIPSKDSIIVKKKSNN